MKALAVIFSLAAAAAVGALAFHFYLLFLPPKPDPRLPGKTLTVGSAAFTVEVADTTSTRMRGLSGRERLSENEGMLFVFSSPGRYGFWMKDMKFPLDFVWMKDGAVVGVTENVPPPAPGTSLFSLSVYYPPSAVDEVLEVNAGEVKRHNLQPGQAVALTP